MRRVTSATVRNFSPRDPSSPSSQGRATPRLSRQLAQLCPSSDSTKRTSIPVLSSTGTRPRFSQISDSYTPHVTKTRSATAVGFGEVGATNWRTGRHSGSGRRPAADAGAGERARLQQQATEEPGRRQAADKRRDGAEAGADEAPPAGVATQRQLGLQRGTQLGS